ncbi:Hypothetical predicted protein [Octopus vulgaris]|uniref:Uncharacterized protein n=1 Tax=Octopus vulgaris TaxID=6645 RepID=A0AA36AXV1_OCTVU|nr:Hypothetical predicted protein [Octopus vulgaris]
MSGRTRFDIFPDTRSSDFISCWVSKPNILLGLWLIIDIIIGQGGAEAESGNCEMKSCDENFGFVELVLDKFFSLITARMTNMEDFMGKN